MNKGIIVGIVAVVIVVLVAGAFLARAQALEATAGHSNEFVIKLYKCKVYMSKFLFLQERLS